MRAFVIAMEKEAEAVRPHLTADDRLYVCGVGKVNAAASTMRAICEGATEIFNCGVAGGIAADVEVGGVYGVSSAVEYDFDLSQPNGTAVGVLNEYDTPYLECASIEGVERFPWFKGWRILATGDHFNDSEVDYPLIAGTLKASLRDMEGAAIAHVCKREGVPFRSLKCVTNVAGRGSMTGQYRDNVFHCLESLSAALKSLRSDCFPA